MKPGSFGTAIGTYPSETTGKWYYEVKIEDPRGEPQRGLIGFATRAYTAPLTWFAAATCARLPARRGAACCTSYYQPVNGFVHALVCLPSTLRLSTAHTRTQARDRGHCRSC